MCGENGEKVIFSLLSPLVKSTTILPMNRIYCGKNSWLHVLKLFLSVSFSFRG
jgi:hypothetical protein